MSEYSMTITSRFENLAEVAQFARNAAIKSGLSAGAADDVELAVDEAITNVIEHAYHGDGNGLITVTCGRQSRDFVVEIRDNGEPFDEGGYRDPKINGSLSERSIGGLGLHFMRKLMDRVEFHHGRASGNLTIMVKRVK